ncbi:MAG: polysulfide reductase NrfD [Candidatus Nitricoxidivorans perseverans]|uniref:Polysulfide reductase NrfD n=1 Tax=Candidatus Nitricoxidivorans perseverans TaxID=2975601 RepID=A0AA49FND3_9PROT|nr:MAG: polysulfide reductase NrfD [Candidatus Nitricoxidivorans perseverans]
MKAQTEERNFYLVAALGALVSAVGMAAALYMEHSGHVVTGMTNQIVWGMPHVFAIFLIVAASGVLNVASIGSVFGKKVYKKRATLAGLLCIAMLAGGLAVIMLDLGRADRIPVAMTHFNPTSVFGWNVILYPGMFGLAAVYIWTMMERRMNPYSHAVGFATFVWRLLLTTGTGSIFGFLVARQAYQSAILAPMFIIMSFAWGLAAFLVVQATMYRWNGMTLHPAVLKRMKNLLGTFIGAVLYFVAVYHLTNLYFAKQVAFEKFLLVGSEFAPLFWIGQILLGSLLPLALIFHPATGKRVGAIMAASLLVIAGGIVQLYVFIIGGQAFPLEIFPGMEVASSFFDGQVEHYTPSLPEILLGVGGIGIAFTMTVIGVRVLDFMPKDDLAKLEAAAD